MSGKTPKSPVWNRTPVAAGVLAVYAVAVIAAGAARADPVSDYDPVAHYDQPQRLPVIAPSPSTWEPQFPFPFDQSRRYVTPADIDAEREMCQWYDAQFDPIKHQIEG